MRVLCTLVIGVLLEHNISVHLTKIIMHTLENIYEFHELSGYSVCR